MFTCLGNVHPTLELVRKWGYDLDLIFTEQDEDLILYSHEYVTVLMELASDPACPKNDYALSILSDFARKQLLVRNKVAIDLIEKHIHAYHIPLTDAVINWKLDFLAISKLIHNPRMIDDIESNSIAFYLIVGPYGRQNFERNQTLLNGMIEYESSLSAYKEFIYINKENSFWQYSLIQLKN